jgi:hypothetical protein
MDFEIVIYEPPHSRPVHVHVPKFSDEDRVWRSRLVEALVAGQTLAIDLAEWGLGAVHDEAARVKQDRTAPADPSAVVLRCSLVEGADLLYVARTVRSYGRRIVWGLCDVVVDRRGPRVAWRVSAADCRLLASRGLLTQQRGAYRHTPIGLGVRAVLLGSVVRIAPKFLEKST